MKLLAMQIRLLFKNSLSSCILKTHVAVTLPGCASELSDRSNPYTFLSQDAQGVHSSYICQNIPPTIHIATI